MCSIADAHPKEVLALGLGNSCTTRATTRRRGSWMDVDV